MRGDLSGPIGPRPFRGLGNGPRQSGRVCVGDRRSLHAHEGSMDSHRPGRRPGQSRPARAARWVGLSSATGSHRSSPHTCVCVFVGRRTSNSRPVTLRTLKTVQSVQLYNLCPGPALDSLYVRYYKSSTLTYASTSQIGGLNFSPGGRNFGVEASFLWETSIAHPR